MNFLDGNIVFKSYFNQTDYRNEVTPVYVDLNDELILNIFGSRAAKDGFCLSEYRSLLEQTQLLINCTQKEQSYPQPRISYIYNHFLHLCKVPVPCAAFESFVADTVKAIAPSFNPQELLEQGSLDKVFQSIPLLLAKESATTLFSPQQKGTSSEPQPLTNRLNRIFKEQLPLIIKIIEELEEDLSYQATVNLRYPYKKFREVTLIKQMNYTHFATFLCQEISRKGIKDSPSMLYLNRNLAKMLKKTDAPLPATAPVTASSSVLVPLPLSSHKEKDELLFAQSRILLLKHVKSLIQAIEETEKMRVNLRTLDKAYTQFKQLSGVALDKVTWKRFLKEILDRHGQKDCHLPFELVRVGKLAAIFKGLFS